MDRAGSRVLPYPFPFPLKEISSAQHHARRPTVDRGATTTARDEAEAALKAMHALDIAWVDPADVSNAVLWLASAEARFVTGAAIPIDGGATAPIKLLTANPESTPTSS